MKYYANTKLWRWLKGFMLKHMYGMITCKEFEDFVADYFDNELSSRQRSKFDMHLRLCKECRQYIEAYQKTIEIGHAVFPSLNEPLPDDVPEDLIKAILGAKKVSDK